jgi:DNA-binding GntR family transcriptional regulator
MEPQDTSSDRLTPWQLWEDVAAILRRDILSGVLTPGTRLIEVDLADRFGVSRGPIREALRELSRVGLVVDRPRQGVFVSTPTDTDLDEITVYREALETAAIRLVLRKATAADIERLRNVLEAMLAAYSAGDKTGGLALDLEFHREIFLLAGNGRMLSAHDDLAAQLLLSATRNKALREGVFPPEWLHRDILDALAAGDEGRSVAAVQAHYPWMGDRLFGDEGGTQNEETERPGAPASPPGTRQPRARRARQPGPAG